MEQQQIDCADAGKSVQQLAKALAEAARRGISAWTSPLTP